MTLPPAVQVPQAVNLTLTASAPMGIGALRSWPALESAEVKRAESSLLIQFDASVGTDTIWTDETLPETTGLKLSEGNRQ